MSVIDGAIYVEGERAIEAANIQDAARAAGEGERFAWVGLRSPGEQELREVQEAFGIHDLAIEDALKGHQRSKLERYGDGLACVVRAAHYDDATETVRFGDLHVLLTSQAVITVRLADEPDLAPVRERLEAEPQLLRLGPDAVLYAVLDEVVDTYGPVVSGLENDIDEIEDQIFSEDAGPGVSRRIYELHREVIGFQRAAQPLVDVLDELRGRGAEREMDVELRRLYRDVHDHVIRVAERIDNFRSLLDNALNAHLALVTQRQTEVGLAQNDQMKKVSGWAAILFAPSLVGAVYGMNFAHMPELEWRYGYPFALGLMAGMAIVLWAVFRRLKWI